MFYLALKSLHIIAIISWMAGILYLFRLYVNHIDFGLHSQENHQMLKGMEYRLYRYITFPAMIISWCAGLSMIYILPNFMASSWLQIKLLCVILLTICTLYAGHLLKVFSNVETIRFKSRTMRFLNEVPTILMILIVIMVVFKP